MTGWATMLVPKPAAWLKVNHRRRCPPATPGISLLYARAGPYWNVPNQRSKNKIRLGGFIERRLYRAVLALAKHEGMAHDKFGFAQKLVREAIERRERKRKPRPRVMA
jgi:hypothetical protein